MARFFDYTKLFVLITLFLLAPFSAAWAAYEVQNPSANAPTGVTPQKPPAVSLDVTWTAPTPNAGDSVVEYVYAWNNSNIALDDTLLNRTINDGVVNSAAELKASKDSTDFAGEDYDSPHWYFHVKTVYLSGNPPPVYSDDVVVGPFNFDDQAPTGTLALDNTVVGQTATTSSVNPVTLALTATADALTVYLSNTTTKPPAGVPFATTLTHTVTDGLGQKTIYVWFEDQAGNVPTTFSTSLTFDMVAGKSMDPAGDFNLLVGDTQSFLILGADALETFDWEIVDPVNTNLPSTAATFSGASTGEVQVDVVGAVEGAFKVRATSNADATVYTSGTVTVTAIPFTLGDVNDSGTIDSGDAILVLRYSVGLTTLTDIQKMAGNVTKKADINAIDSGDAIKILRYSVGLISNFD